jgi:uncharacterized protein YjbI with pentapeptide repeats
MDEQELKNILDKHFKWLRGENGGKRADLSGANLSRANLFGANLSRANLSRANLSRANLSGADLSGANLFGANLFRANLFGANLFGANLFGANLFEANYIEKAKNLFYPIACPEIGAFVGWKKARVKTSGHECIVKLEITEDAVRSSGTGRKCRCSKATVLEIQDLEGIVLEQVAVSDRDENFHYIPGTVVSVSDFDENRWNECSTGIHFYITREEAVRHIL